MLDMSRDPSKLAPRELEALLLVTALHDQGSSSKAIGRRMRVKPDTVDQYLKRAMAKLGAADRFEAARMVAAPLASDLEGVEPSVRSSGHRTSVLSPDIPYPSLDEPSEQQVADPIREVGEAPAEYFALSRQPDVGQAEGWLEYLPRSLRPLVRSRDGHNRLSTEQRMLLSVDVWVRVVLAGAALLVALLAFGSIRNEYRHQRFLSKQSGLDRTIEGAIMAQANPISSHLHARLTKHLEATHDAIDAAIVESASCVAALVRARKLAGVSGVVGEAELGALVDGIVSLRSARTRHVDAHIFAKATGIDLGLITAEGDTFPKPGGVALSLAEPHVQSA